MGLLDNIEIFRDFFRIDHVTQHQRPVVAQAVLYLGEPGLDVFVPVKFKTGNFANYLRRHHSFSIFSGLSDYRPDFINQYYLGFETVST